MLNTGRKTSGFVTLFQVNVMTLAKLAIPFAAIWGLVCGIFERLVLAPQRRLSLVGPAYLPGMAFALLAGCSFAVDVQRIRFLFALLMAVVFFIAGAAPALAVFRLSRWMFRTRFADRLH